MKKRKALAPEPVGLTPAETAARLAPEIEQLRGIEAVQPSILARLQVLHDELLPQDQHGHGTEQHDTSAQPVAASA